MWLYFIHRCAVSVCCQLYGVLNGPFEQRKGKRAKHWDGGVEKEAEMGIAVTLGPKRTQELPGFSKGD